MCAVEFSANVEVKYEAYMKERTEYLERNKVSLHGMCCILESK